MKAREKGRYRTTTVLIAAGQERRVYKSLRAVPSFWRRKLEAATTGENSALLVIADRAGRNELGRGLAQAARKLRPDGGRFVDLRLALELALCGGLALGLWLLAVWR